MENSMWSEVTQSCPTVCDPMDYSPPGSSIHGIFQARVLEWDAISFPIEVPVCMLSRVWLSVTSQTVAHQSPLSVGFSRQEYWSVLPFPSWGYLPNPEIKHRSPTLQADSLPTKLQGKPSIKFLHLFYSSVAPSVSPWCLFQNLTYISSCKFVAQQKNGGGNQRCGPLVTSIHKSRLWEKGT